MADAIRKAIKKVRHKFRREEKIESPFEIAYAKFKGKIHAQALWESDKKRKRDENFKKARQAMEANREQRKKERESEEKRQAEINKTRLKNLKKARRKLAKKRRNNGK